jgi:predicted porin
MKKHLLAVAVASAIAAPAMAQNVSFYGTIGAGVSQTSQSIGADSTSFDGGGEVGTGLSTTVFGMKISEDLGGGLKAFAQFEGDFKPTIGTVGKTAYDTENHNQDALFNRQAHIGFSMAGMGSLKLGRTGDVIDSNEGFANFVQLFDTEAADEGGIGNKNQNTVRYDSEKLLGGLTFAVSYSNDARQPSTAAATTFANQKVSTYGVNYSAGAVTIGYAKGDAATTASDATTNEAIYTVYAGYKIGAADIRVQRTEETTKANVNNTTSEASISYALGGGLTVVGHYEKFDQSGTTTTTDYKQMGAMLVKDLSKRTSVYAGYRNRDVQGAGTDITVTSVGVRHTF